MKRQDLDSFVGHFLAFLQAAYRHNLAQEFEPIIAAQRQMHGHEGQYLVGNAVFVRGMHSVPFGYVNALAFAPLDPSLKAAHDKWYARHEEFEKEWSKVRQILPTILLRAKSWQDIRDMLPDYVIRPHLVTEGHLRDLDRTRPDLYAGDPHCWGPQLTTMYGRIAPIIDKYLGYTLL